MSEVTLSKATFIILSIKLTWDNPYPCSNVTMVSISYNKVNMTMVHTITTTYNLANDINGRIILIENLEPGQQYYYTASLLDNSDVNTTGMFGTINEGKHSFCIAFHIVYHRYHNNNSTSMYYNHY